MNLILWDYDLVDKVDRIKDLLGTRENCQVASIKESINIATTVDTPVKGVVLTALHSGWLKYHSEIAEKYPFVTHWIFCVIDMFGDALKETTVNQFVGTSANDVYCELIFDDTSFSTLLEKLDEPTKTQKRCLIISLNNDLVDEVKEVLQCYIPEWDIATSTKPKPDYTLCDSVIVVGNTVEEMNVIQPEIRSIRVCFWMNTPHFKNMTDVSVDKVILGKQMNEVGWNIGDYSSRVFFSSIHHEQVYRLISEDEMTPEALQSDPLFVLWDDYGLPMVQSGIEKETVLSFLKSHTVFPEIADRFCITQKRRNQNEI